MYRDHVRDSQRGKLYRAEREAFPGMGSRREPEIPLDEVRQIVDAITTSEWWLDRSLTRGVEVRDGRGRINAGAMTRAITLPRWARSMPVILHELAHVLNHGIQPRAAHGREYARGLLALIDRWMGPGEAARLRAAFKKNHVHWREARVISPEEKARMRARFEAMRAAKGKGASGDGETA